MLNSSLPSLLAFSFLSLFSNSGPYFYVTSRLITVIRHATRIMQRGVSQTLNFFFLEKSVVYGVVQSKLVQLKRITDGDLVAEPTAAEGHGGLEAMPSAAGKFWCCFGKTSHFNPIWFTFHRLLERFERTYCKTWLPSKRIELSSPFSSLYLQIKSKARLNVVVIPDFIYFSEFVCCQISRAWIFSNLVFILHQIFPCSIFTVTEADLVNFHTESSITSSSASCALFQLCLL